ARAHGAPDQQALERRPGGLGDLLQSAEAVVAEELRQLSVGRRLVEAADCILHVAVGDEEIEPAVIVEIGELRAKAKPLQRRLAQPRLETDLLETVLPLIPKEGAALV